MSSPFLGMFFLEDQPQLPAAHTLTSQGSWCFSCPQWESQGFRERKAQTKWAAEDSSAYRLSSGSETGNEGTRGASCLGSFCRTLLGLLLCLPLMLGMCHFRLCLVVIYCLPPMLVSFCTSSLLLGRMLLSKFSTEEYTNDGELELEALRETTLWLFQSNKITKTSTTRNGTD